MHLVLASSSPRRADLLRSIGIEFVAIAADIDETPTGAEDAKAYVVRMAREKRASVEARLVVDEVTVVVAADTIVVVDGEILGKPVDHGEARAMLRRLSGRSHQVYSAVSISARGRMADVVVSTDVWLAELNEWEIGWYVGLGESLDKAGGYGMQTGGAVLIDRIEGSPSNVIGLPLRDTVALLASLGVRIADITLSAGAAADQSAN